MKKGAILSLCVFMLLLAVCAYSAAADVTVTSVFNKDNPTFGSDNQESSNPNADDEEDMVVHVTKAVTILNNGTNTVTITGVTVIPKSTGNGQTFTLNELNVTLLAPVELLAGSSTSVTLSARIPEDLDAVDKNLRERAFYVADITLKDNGGASVATFNAYMQRENNLKFDKVYVKIGESTHSVDDDDTVDEVKPGDYVEVEVIAENNFNDNDDVEIENVEVLVLIDDSDLDVDEDADMGDMKPEKKKTETIEFDVEDDVDDDDYLMEITVEGKDENGALHGERIEIEFTVEKNDHEIKIDSISVVPTSVSCGEAISVRVEVVNIGADDEDEVTIRVMNEDLEIDTLKPNIVLDEGDSSVKTFDLTIPEDAGTGAKPFTVISYYEYNEESHRDVFTVEVTSCESAETTEEGEDNVTTSQDTTTAVNTGGTTTAQPVSDSTTTPSPVTTVRTSGSGFRDSALYIILLVIGIVALVAIATVLIVKFTIAK